ncbi:MAG: LapA family protein [bacterium]
MQALRMVFWLGVFTLFAMVLMQNKWMLEEASYLRFYFQDYQTPAIPVPMVIAGSMLIGSILVSLSTLMAQIRSRSVLKKQAGQIKVLENELAELRNLPLSDAHSSGMSESGEYEYEEEDETPEDEPVYVKEEEIKEPEE